MNPCPHHYDPGCERCRATYTPEVHQQIEDKQKDSPTKSSSFKEFAIVMAILIGIFGPGLYLLCSSGGFLRPDREVALLEVSDGVWCSEIRMSFVWDDKSVDFYLPAKDINVALRQDGQAHTSLILKNRSCFGNYYCNNATILVPDQKDLEGWNTRLKTFTENGLRRLVPRRVVP